MCFTLLLLLLYVNRNLFRPNKTASCDCQYYKIVFFDKKKHYFSDKMNCKKNRNFFHTILLLNLKRIFYLIIVLRNIKIHMKI